jgi:hypothetical protein
VTDLVTACEHVMTSRIYDITRSIKDGALTDAVRSVHHAEPCSPWTTVGDACYEAEIPGGTLVSLTFLLNGAPLDRLPRDVVEHNSYTRTFGNRQFEVEGGGGAAFKTARPVFGCTYKWVAPPRVGGALRIVEISTEGEVLQLLDATSTDTPWQGTLSRRLRHTYSHWWWREGEAVVLRGIGFLERDVAFIIKIRDTQAGRSYECLRVPDHLHKAPSDKPINLKGLCEALGLAGQRSAGLSAPDRFVHLNRPSLLLEVLSRFEEGEYIETYEGGPTRRLKVTWPRFGLSF